MKKSAEKPATSGLTVLEPLRSVRLAIEVARSTPASAELRREFARALVDDAKARVRRLSGDGESG